MHIVLGATGNVGSATVQALLRKGEAVTAVTHNPAHAQVLEHAGAKIAVADVLDVETLRAIFRSGRRAFLLNPPAAVTGDTDTEERRCNLFSLPISYCPWCLQRISVLPQRLDCWSRRRQVAFTTSKDLIVTLREMSQTPLRRRSRGLLMLKWCRARSGKMHIKHSASRRQPRTHTRE